MSGDQSSAQGAACPTCGRPPWGFVKGWGEHFCPRPTYPGVRGRKWQCWCGARWKYGVLRVAWRRTLPTLLGWRGRPADVEPPVPAGR